MKYNRFLLAALLCGMAAGCDIPTDEVSTILEQDTRCLLSRGFPLQPAQEELLPYIISCSQLKLDPEKLRNQDKSEIVKLVDCGINPVSTDPKSIERMTNVIKALVGLAQYNIQEVTYRSESISQLSMILYGGKIGFDPDYSGGYYCTCGREVCDIDVACKNGFDMVTGAEATVCAGYSLSENVKKWNSDFNKNPNDSSIDIPEDQRDDSANQCNLFRVDDTGIDLTVDSNGLQILGAVSTLYDTLIDETTYTQTKVKGNTTSRTIHRTDQLNHKIYVDNDNSITNRKWFTFQKDGTALSGENKYDFVYKKGNNWELEELSGHIDSNGFLKDDDSEPKTDVFIRRKVYDKDELITTLENALRVALCYEHLPYIINNAATKGIVIYNNEALKLSCGETKYNYKTGELTVPCSQTEETDDQFAASLCGQALLQGTNSVSFKAYKDRYENADDDTRKKKLYEKYPWHNIDLNEYMLGEALYKMLSPRYKTDNSVIKSVIPEYWEYRLSNENLVKVMNINMECSNEETEFGTTGVMKVCSSIIGAEVSFASLISGMDSKGAFTTDLQNNAREVIYNLTNMFLKNAMAEIPIPWDVVNFGKTSEESLRRLYTLYNCEQDDPELMMNPYACAVLGFCGNSSNMTNELCQKLYLYFNTRTGEVTWDAAGTKVIKGQWNHAFYCPGFYTCNTNQVNKVSTCGECIDSPTRGCHVHHENTIDIATQKATTTYKYVYGVCSNATYTNEGKECYSCGVNGECLDAEGNVVAQ
jgi:hypothetical protein